ncbi:hypothetical protein SAMN05216302_100993 [Nitrosomonas aestuarii]|uniref:Uncharacterized protein n=1 Tax=Nitrosomonas aestuarii TaxID=52441 RepID=A0A1I4ALC0_9PROT|nr:hypothetical protein [Nitrosomonas aestuarii]SFK57278.1 hypothetical protein SAMN05216302_100993 [Nitrosomonas aestuarii]
MTYMTDYYDDLEEMDELDEFYAYDEYDEDDFDYYLDEFDEDDEFLKDAWNWLTKKGSTQRRVALSAAKNALVGAGGGLGGTLGTAAGPAGTVAGTAGGSLLGGALAGLLPDQMDYLADLAVESYDEDEADEFLSALVPLAARLLPTAARAVRRVAPRLVSGVSRVARTLHRNPATRQMIRQLPNIVRNTTKDVTRQYARTGNISGKTAAKMLAKRTYEGLSQPTATKKRTPKSVLAQKRPGMTKRYSRSKIIRTPQGYCRCYYR